MRKEVVACDRCGLQAKLGSESESFRLLRFTKIKGIDPTQAEWTRDLCGPCVADIAEFIARPPA